MHSSWFDGHRYPVGLSHELIQQKRPRTRFHFIRVFRPGKDLLLKATARFNQESDSMDSSDQFQMAPSSKTML